MDTYGDGTHIWKVADLWEAAKNIEPVMTHLTEIADIEALLDSHCWSAGPMSVREILEHADRIANADLSCPIILTPDGAIADGCHRLIKALKEGRKFLPIIKLPSMPEPIKKQEEPYLSAQCEKADKDLGAFQKDLETLINYHSIENLVNEPDFTIARFLVDCLRSWQGNVGGDKLDFNLTIRF